MLRTSIMLLGLVSALGAASCVAKPAPASDNAASPGAAPSTPSFVARFDASAGELPEGLLLRADSALVGFAPSSRIVRVDLANGTATAFGRLPAPVPGKGFMTGLAQGARGDVYVGLASFVPEVIAGIYRLPKDGGEATLFAKDPQLPFPNALAFDATGNLFVTDSGTGSVFRVDASGHAERWATGELLAGKAYHCGPGLGPGFDIGANGLVVEDDAVFVVNSDKATVVKIPRNAAGGAGTPALVAGPDCAQLGGADGLARAPNGSFVVAVNRQDKLVRVSRSGAIEVVKSGRPFDFPASVAYRGADLFVTNFALYTATQHQNPAPGLLMLPPSGTAP